MMETLMLEMGVIIHEQLSQAGLEIQAVHQSDNNEEMELLKALKHEMMETLITLMVEVIHALLRLGGLEIQAIHLYDRNEEMV